MNWEAIGAFAELLAAVAVVLSLIYVAIQIRESSKITKATSAQSLLEGSSLIWQQAMYNPEAIALRVKITSGEARFTPEELANLGLLSQQILNHQQMAFILHEEGMLREDVYEMYRSRARTVHKMIPVFDAIWPALKENYLPKFQVWVEETMIEK